MKKTILFATLLISALFVHAQKCVLLDFQIGSNVTAEEVEAVSYEFRSTFNPSCYTVEEKFKVNRTLKDLGFDVTAMNKEQLRKLGREMVATMVVYGSLSKYMDEYTLDVNVMDISTGTTIINQYNTFQKSEYRTHTRRVSEGIVSKLCKSSSGTSTGGSGAGSGTATNTAKPTVPAGYTDLGLPSGTLWKNFNATGYYTYDEAVRQFGGRLPTKDQLEELRAECQWSWTGNGYKITGVNGNSIVFPASGYRFRDGKIYNEASSGCYWTSMPSGSNDAYYLVLTSKSVHWSVALRGYGLTVRLVYHQ